MAEKQLGDWGGSNESFFYFLIGVNVKIPTKKGAGRQASRKKAQCLLGQVQSLRKAEPLP